MRPNPLLGPKCHSLTLLIALAGPKTSCNARQCCGSGMFFHPGSKFSPSWIPDPHQRIKYFNPENCF